MTSIFGYELDRDVPTEDVERLVLRALREGVRLQRSDLTGAWIASRPGTSNTYVVTPRGCTCPAGAHARPCKHLCLVLLVNEVTRGP